MIEEDEHTPGRPYGGVALICKRIDGLIYEPINSRIIDMNDNPVHLIIYVYMPYYNRGVSRLQVGDMTVKTDRSEKTKRSVKAGRFCSWRSEISGHFLHLKMAASVVFILL